MNYWQGLMEYGKARANKITWMPPLRKGEFGYLLIDKESWFIDTWHTFDDYGYDIEVVECIKNNNKIEVYSDDQGETWRFDIN